MCTAKNKWTAGECIICGNAADHALCHNGECMEGYLEGMMFKDSASVLAMRTMYEQGAAEIIVEMNRLFDEAKSRETDAERFQVVRDGYGHLFRWYCDSVGPWSEPWENVKSLEDEPAPKYNYAEQVATRTCVK